MSYAIFTVCYGLPLSSGQDRARSVALRKLIEREPAGLFTMYSGSASEVPAAFGIRLGGFDECCHHVDLAQIQTNPTEQQKKDYSALFAALSTRDQEVLKSLGEPRIFFLASSS